MTQKTAIIIGAGPAGLTAAYELLTRSDIKPILYEMTDEIGGISRTVNFKGNRIDIGGHRFFSKSDVVMDWWQNQLPVQGSPARDELLLHTTQHYSEKPGAPDPEKVDRVMLLRHRVSRIFYRRSFFDYPVSLNWNTVKNLGFFRMFHIGLSYMGARLKPIRPEKSLEDFMVNRFGQTLYETFFRDYTTKVWGIPPSGIKPEWGAQRIKGISIAGVLKHALVRMFARKKKKPDIYQKDVETSLIDQFMYPKLGPGQLWEEVARHIVERGGEIHMKHRVESLQVEGERISGIMVSETGSAKAKRVTGDFYISTMPIRDLIAGMKDVPPANVREVAAGLTYRDFVTVGLLLKRMKIQNKTKIPTLNNMVPDNWIYVQESDVRVGRLQIFNNWSPYMVQDLNNAWIGLEYFCNEGDDLWNMADAKFSDLAVEELSRIDIIEPDQVLDSVVIRSPKTYPAYFGTYDRFDEVRRYVDGIHNLYLVGRNGMHRYNNMDHSMLTAMEAVKNILSGDQGRENIWRVNTEQEYHEKK